MIFPRLRRWAPSSRGAGVVARPGRIGFGGLIMPGERGAAQEDLAPLTLDRFPYIPMDLVNNVGADLVLGDVVAVSIADSGCVVGSDLFRTRGIYVVVAETSIQQGAPGRFAFSGEVLVKASGTIALGEYVQKSGATRSVEGLGQTRINGTPQLPPPNLALGHAVEASSGGFVRCFWYGLPEPGLSIANAIEFHEDFESRNLAAAIAIQVETWKYVWRRASAADSTGSYGVMRVTGDGALAPSFHLGYTTPMLLPFSALDGALVLEMRFAQVGVAAGTRRLGLGGAAIQTADPVNGMYFRFTVGGNIFGVCRSGGVESTVDTGIAAADGSMRTASLVYDGLQVYTLINGARVGSPITTNIPTVALGPSGGNSVVTAANGFDVDAIRVLAPRSPSS